MVTGDDEYYIHYKRGTHELRKIVDDDDSDYEVVFTGNLKSCMKEFNKIKEKNFEYDYNL